MIYDLIISLSYLQTTEDQASRGNFELAKFSNKPDIPDLCLNIHLVLLRQSKNKITKVTT